MNDSTPRRHVSPAILEMKIKSLELQLLNEKRDHAETMRQRNALQQRVNGFERMSKALAGRVDELEENIG